MSDTLGFFRLEKDVELPTRAYGKAIGYDLSAYLISDTGRSIQALLPPRTSRLIRTGLVLLPPLGYFLCICSRSGLASSQPPVFVANAPGIVDPDYTGEIKIILYNGGHEAMLVRHGDRIAQAILLPSPPPFALAERSELPSTERGVKGFGSTGV